MHPARTYVLFMFLFGLGLGMPVTTYVPGLLALGLSLSDVAFVNMWFWATVVLMELPTGMIADGKSRAWSIHLSCMFMAAGSFTYACCTGLWSAVAAEITVGVGIAFFSGAAQAWVTDALVRRGGSDNLSKVFGTAALARALGMLSGGVIGAGLGYFDLRLGWIGGGIVQLATLILTVRAMTGDGEPEVRMTEFQAFSASWQALRKNSALVWSVAAAMILGFILPFNHYWTPFFKERTGQVGLAGVWIITYGSCAVGGWLMRRKNVCPGAEPGSIFAALFVTGISLSIIGLLPGIALPMVLVFVHEVGRGVFDPLLEVYTQRRIESAYRATYGSLQSLLSKFGYAGIVGSVWLCTSGMPTNIATISSVWLAAGLLMAAASVALWLKRPAK